MPGRDGTGPPRRRGPFAGRGGGWRLGRGRGRGVGGGAVPWGRSPPKPLMVAVVDEERCAGCGICAEVCNRGAIRVDDTAKVDEKKCNGCGACEKECPNEAIVLRKRQVGPKTGAPGG